ncbi:hypothetical protein [Candidatus Liberibacter asiaticus]|uniref:hypothetical protein n=1 Tax=Liberibacter asiaticus TaxID=34021 RepID=UPI001F0A46E7|nr:hypothetical protein [Candidatus Liberibacter asiaticus]
MNQILKNQIVDSLKVLSIPGEKNNIVEMQRLSEIFIVHNTVYLSITVPPHYRTPIAILALQRSTDNTKYSHCEKCRRHTHRK